MTALIETHELAARLGKSHLRILDASWHMPATGRNAAAEYAAEHIPGAMFFNIDAVSDKASPYPHMLPSSADVFAENVSKLGIANTDEVVVYDSSGIFSAPRVWWMFRVFGHDKVKVLSGGLPKWKAEGRAIEKNRQDSPNKALFNAHFRPELLRTLEQVRSNISTQHELLLDARSQGRFNGTEPEPRAGLRSGHIEGSKNIFFKDCLTPEGTLKQPAELRSLFMSNGIDPGEPLLASCGSGVTACILALALYELGNKNVAVYDGAWAEWGM